MRITFELEPDDIERFHAALARVRRSTDCADEVEIIDAAKYALDHLCAGSTPAYVRKRLVEVQRLIVMLEDETWALTDPERADIVATLAYFSDPDDLIPDEVEVIGLLDDAIMLELLLRRQRKVRKAYDEFCLFRDRHAHVQDRAGRARALAELRTKLHARMRRPLRRARAVAHRSA